MARERGFVEDLFGQYARGVAKDAAVFLLTQKWFLQVIAYFTRDGKSAAHAFKVIAAAAHLGGNGWIAYWANFFSDEVAAEVAERLKDNPDLIGQVLDDMPETEEEAVSVLLDGLGKVNDKEAFLVGGILHKEMECLRVAEFIAAHPPRKRKGKGGVVITEPNAQVVSTTFLRALEAGRPLCPSCYRGGKIEFANAEPKTSGKTLFELIREIEADLQPEDENQIAPDLLAHVCAFREEFHGLPSKLKSKFVRLVKMPKAKERLLIVLGNDAEHRESVLDTMLDPKENLAEGVSQKVAGYFARRFADESEEQSGFAKGFGDSARKQTRSLRQRRIDSMWQRAVKLKGEIVLLEHELETTWKLRLFKRRALKLELENKHRELNRLDRRRERAAQTQQDQQEATPATGGNEHV